MSLDEQYPKTCTNETVRWRALLQQDAELDAGECENLALTLNAIADLAADFADIGHRLLNETHSPAEVGELLIAAELTLEQIRGQSDTVDGKLYEIGDRLRGTALPVSTPKGRRKKAM